MRNSFEEAVKELTLKYPQYAADAYEFMRAGLDYTVNLRKGTQENKHLTATELYTGALNYALEEYGPLACKVLQFWGIKTSHDFGCIVYNLIEAGIFGKQKGDRQEEFDVLPDPEIILNQPYNVEFLDALSKTENSDYGNTDNEDEH